jgi:hypothetical protein
VPVEVAGRALAHEVAVGVEDALVGRTAAGVRIDVSPDDEGALAGVVDAVRELEDGVGAGARAVGHDLVEVDLGETQVARRLSLQVRVRLSGPGDSRCGDPSRGQPDQDGKSDEKLLGQERRGPFARAFPARGLRVPVNLASHQHLRLDQVSRWRLCTGPH